MEPEWMICLPQDASMFAGHWIANFSGVWKVKKSKTARWKKATGDELSWIQLNVEPQMHADFEKDGIEV